MLAPIFNNNFNNNYKKQINRFRPSFGYRLSCKIYTDIRDIPHLKCGCCGDDTFTSDGIKKFLDTFAADSRSVLKNRVLDRFRDTEAFKFIQALSDEQPKKTVREILNSGEGQEKIRALDPRMQLAIMQIGIYTDGISVTAPKVIKKLQKYYSNFGRDLQEIFHLMEFYSIKYPDKTFAEIFREPDVANYHAKVFELTANDASARKINIFKQLRDLSSTLSVKDKKLLQKTNTDAMVILNNGLYQSHINKALIEDMYASIGFGAISPNKIITRLLEEYKKEHEEDTIEEKIQELVTEKIKKKKVPKTGVVVKGIDNCLVKFSKCCNPVPGDDIIGYITKGRGVSIHRKDCTNLKDLLSEEERIIEVEWYNEKVEAEYNVDIQVLANDRTGLLSDVVREITNQKINIMGVNTRTSKDRIATIEATLEVKNIEQLNQVIKQIRKVDSVYEVTRKK